MNDNKKITKSFLKSTGYKARDENSVIDVCFEDELNRNDFSNVQGCCDNIVNYIYKKITQRGVCENNVRRKKCSVKGQMHFVILIECDSVAEYNCNGKILVDASIDQFCDEQYNIGRVDSSLGSFDSLPRVAILPPDDERRKTWYDNID